MFICFLAGGLRMSITTGSVDVLFVQADAVKTQGSFSASVDLALGRCLLVFGALVAMDRAGARPPRKPRARAELVGSDACHRKTKAIETDTAVGAARADLV
jgi:hypothetical protein